MDERVWIRYDSQYFERWLLVEKYERSRSANLPADGTYLRILKDKDAKYFTEHGWRVRKDGFDIGFLPKELSVEEAQATAVVIWRLK